MNTLNESTRPDCITFYFPQFDVFVYAFECENVCVSRRIFALVSIVEMFIYYFNFSVCVLSLCMIQFLSVFSPQIVCGMRGFFSLQHRTEIAHCCLENFRAAFEIPHFSKHHTKDKNCMFHLWISLGIALAKLFMGFHVPNDSFSHFNLFHFVVFF